MKERKEKQVKNNAMCVNVGNGGRKNAWFVVPRKTEHTKKVQLVKQCTCVHPKNLISSER